MCKNIGWFYGVYVCNDCNLQRGSLYDCSTGSGDPSGYPESGDDRDRGENYGAANRKRVLDSGRSCVGKGICTKGAEASQGGCAGKSAGKESGGKDTDSTERDPGLRAAE